MSHVCPEPDAVVTGPTVILFPPSPKEFWKESDGKSKKTLVCLATGFYPDHISMFWLVNEEKWEKGVATDSAALQPKGEKFYKISSRLRVAAEDWFNPNLKFTCKVSFFNGTSTEFYNASLHGEGASALFRPDLYKSWPNMSFFPLQLQSPGTSLPEVNRCVCADHLLIPTTSVRV